MSLRRKPIEPATIAMAPVVVANMFIFGVLFAIAPVVAVDVVVVATGHMVSPTQGC